MKYLFVAALCFGAAGHSSAQSITDTIHPSSTEAIIPIKKAGFNVDSSTENVPSHTPSVYDSSKPGSKAKCPCCERVQGGNPRTVNGYLVFDGAMDGNRQVDPQIAVGGGYVLHGTNGGLVIYDKKGNYIQGVSQKCFNDGIDPKLAFDIHNKMFMFDLWWYYDKPKIKPINISVSATSDPRGAWNIYAIPSTKEVDGGGLGYSKKWIGYSFPWRPRKHIGVALC
jgi:hypothetical protein